MFQNLIFIHYYLFYKSNYLQLHLLHYLSFYTLIFGLCLFDRCVVAQFLQAIQLACWHWHTSVGFMSTCLGSKFSVYASIRYDWDCDWLMLTECGLWLRHQNAFYNLNIHDRFYANAPKGEKCIAKSARLLV